MSPEPRTEVLRRRIELYLHCICEDINTTDPSMDHGQDALLEGRFGRTHRVAWVDRVIPS